MTDKHVSGCIVIGALLMGCGAGAPDGDVSSAPPERSAGMERATAASDRGQAGAESTARRDEARRDEARRDEARQDEARSVEARPDQARPDQARPDQARPGEVDLRVTAQTDTGVVPSDHVEEFPIYLDLANESDRAVRLDHVVARVQVEREGELVCESSESSDPGSESLLAEGEPLIIPARETRRLATSLPCALSEIGDYDVLVDVLFGDDERLGAIAPSDPRAAASVRLNVTEDRPPYMRDRPALAEVPVREVELTP